jgi:molecular chaperone GrpE
MAAKKKGPAPEAEQPETETAPETVSGESAEGEVLDAPKAPDAEEKLRAEQEKYLRLAAEYDNFRKRSARERESIYADVRAATLESFLPTYDNLERALKQATEDEAYKKGVEMIMQGFVSAMEKLGVTEMECLGQKFDPAFHNAVMHVDDEEKGENEIVEVFQQGFMLGDKVIRFAMVKVAN